MAAFEDFQGLLPLLKKYGGRAATGLGAEAALGSPMAALGALPHMLPSSVKQTGKNLLFGGPGKGAPPQDSPDYAPPVTSSQPSGFNPTAGTQPTSPTQVQPQHPSTAAMIGPSMEGGSGFNPGLRPPPPAPGTGYTASNKYPGQVWGQSAPRSPTDFVHPIGRGLLTEGIGESTPGTISSLSAPSMMSGRVNDMLSSFFGTDIGALGGQSIQNSMKDDAMGRDMFMREHAADLNQRYIQQAMMMEQLKSMPREQALELMQAMPGLMGGMAVGGGDPRMEALRQSALTPFIGSQGAQPSGGATAPGQPGQAGRGEAAKPKASFLESALQTGIPAFAAQLPFILPQTRGLGMIPKLAGSLAAGYGAHKGMQALDPNYANMDPSGVGEGAGILASLLGGRMMPKGAGAATPEAGVRLSLPGMTVNPLPSLQEAESGLGAATGGAPSQPGVNVAPMQQTEAATMGTPPFANQGVSMTGAAAQPQTPSMTPIMQTQAMQPRPQPPQNMLEWLKAYYGGQLPQQPPQQPQQ